MGVQYYGDTPKVNISQVSYHHNGCADFFVTLTTDDEFSCTRHQDVMTAAFALRHVTLETQSRGKLHMHSISYAVRGDRAESCAYISGSV